MYKAVSSKHISLIKELQSLNSLKIFSLGGGTNLAFRYNHRKSIDIDLFCSDNIGITGFSEIETELKEKFKSRLLQLNYPLKKSDQYIFLRALILDEEGTPVKVEILHNMKRLDDIEIIEGIRLVTKRDIGLFKLISASNRKADKDIYDLDYITEDISLIKLFEDLIEKNKKYPLKVDKSIFEQDNNCPTLKPELLLAFDTNHKSRNDRPIHSSNYLDLLAESKKWNSVKYDWRSKVRKLFNHLELDFPSIASEL